MDCTKVGNLIYKLRKEKNLTQKQLGDILNISDKTVSKWERGLGIPDVSLLSDLSKALNVNIESMLKGEITENDGSGGNMKKIKFYVCPSCGNILTSTNEAGVFCCGKELKELDAKKADENEKLDVSVIDNEYYVTTKHSMKKEHYLSFIALASNDTVVIKKLYPEWGVDVRLPYYKFGVLFWYCTEHGLFYMQLKK